jgi:hypothetical protein
MIQIEEVDFLDFLEILIGKKDGDLVDMFLTLLPKDFEFTSHDISELEDCMDMTSMFGGYRTELDFVNMMKLLNERGLYK